MLHDERFGLPLSLGEALRADPSREAAQLAQLLDEDESPQRTAGLRRRRDHTWRTILASLAIATAVGTSGHAATVTFTPASLPVSSLQTARLPASGLEGHWIMAPATSSFREAVTGPAPDQATMTVSRDDPDHLNYELVELRGGEEVARGAYTLSFGGAASVTRVDGADLRVSAARTSDGGVLIQAPQVGDLRAVIHVRRTGPDTAVIEHDVEEGGRPVEVERISLVRASDQ